MVIINSCYCIWCFMSCNPLSLYMKCLNVSTGTWCVVCMPRTKLPDVLFQCAISIFMYTTSMVWLDYV